MPMMTVTCETCEGRKMVGTPDEETGYFKWGDCPTCCGTGRVEVELKPGIKVTYTSGPDSYSYVVAHIFSPTHLGLLTGDTLPTDSKLRVLKEITLRRDGVWRERGCHKNSGGRFELGYAYDYRSREV